MEDGGGERLRGASEVVEARHFAESEQGPVDGARDTPQQTSTTIMTEADY